MYLGTRCIARCDRHSGPRTWHAYHGRWYGAALKGGWTVNLGFHTMRWPIGGGRAVVEGDGIARLLNMTGISAIV